MQDKDYKKRFAISQSAIKDWRDLPPQKWYDSWVLGKRKRRISEAVDFGSLLDTLLFNPELFDKRFIISEVRKPSDNITQIVTNTFNHLVDLNKNAKELNETNEVKIPLKKMDMEANKEVVSKFAKEADYFVATPDRAYNEVIKKGTEYFNFLKKCKGRTVIVDEQKALADELAMILKTDKVSAGFFVAKKGCEVLFQQQIFVDYPIEGLEKVDFIPIKGMTDIIHFNHKRKEVREVDLKYTNDAYGFNSGKGPVRMFDYPGQHSFYDVLIREWIKTYQDGKYADYTVCNPLNVVIDDDLKLPYLYEYNQNDLYIKRYGVEGTYIKGWHDILHEIAWHLDKNDWTRPREHLLHGKLAINVFSKR